MENFTVTVILISYNNFRYIFEALDSIFQQTYSNIQLIISDDCSSDFKKRKISRYIRRHAKSNITDVVINVNKENLGTVKHLEGVHKLCKGELIITVAADDAFADDQVLDRLAAEYAENNKQFKIITSRTALCGNKLNKIKSRTLPDVDIRLINEGDSRRILGNLAHRNFIPFFGAAVAPEVFDSVGSLTNDYVYEEGWILYLRAVRMGINIKCLEEVSVLRRSNSYLSGEKQKNRNASQIYSCDLLAAYKNEIEPYANLLPQDAGHMALMCYKCSLLRYNQMYNQEESVEDECSGKKKIVFYFRKGIQAKGDFALFYGIASQLAKYEEYAVYCVNNSFVEMQGQYLDSNIHFCDITDKNRHFFEGATFVSAFSHMFFLLEELEKIKDAKVLFVVLHPQVCKWLSLQVGKSFNFENLFKLLTANKSCAYIDAGTLYACQRYCSVQLEELYFPVNTSFDNIHQVICHEVSDNINIVWYGRLDKDKIYSLTNFLNNLIGFDLGKPVTIHIIGDGNARGFIHTEKYEPQFKFIFNSFMYGEEKDRYLTKNADMVLAMGMSSLDAARLKIPVVVPIISPVSFKENKFVLFCDEKGYCLGTNSEDMKDVGMKTYRAHKIVELCCGDLRDEIGEKCYTFAKDNFSIDKQIENYVSLITTTTLCLKDFRKNKSVKNQIKKFKLYRLLRGGKRGYASYVAFKEKINKFNSKVRKFLNMPFKKKMQAIKHKLFGSPKEAK